MFDQNTTTIKTRLNIPISFDRIRFVLTRIDFWLATQYGIIGILCLLLLINIAYKAWIFEDSFITFRTISNLFEGYGLRWNIDERVQTYTHPLWMLLHIPFYAITGNMFLTSLSLSIGLTISACAITFVTLKKRISFAILALGFTVPLLLSKSFTIFATSGFECPLIFCLYAVFSRVLFLWLEKIKHINADEVPVPWFTLVFIAALCITTRLDTAILFLPVFVVFGLRQIKYLPWHRILLGLSPIILWELFSLIYYGMPFPNTKYAKLDGGMELIFYLRQGWFYWLDLMRLDLISAAAILVALVTTVIWIYQYFKNRDLLSLLMACLGLGLVFYILYIFRIGGAHFALRHWAVPFFIGLIYIHYSAALIKISMQKQLLPVACCLLLLAFSMQYAFHPNYYNFSNKNKISFQHYNNQYRLKGWDYVIRLARDEYIDFERYKKPAEQIKREAEKNEGIYYKFNAGGVGMIGYYAGPKVVFSDTPALTDPLLARLPVDNPKYSYIDHMLRTKPKGYEEARMRGDYSKMDPNLARYYRTIRLITRAPVFDFQRLITVVAFNLGFYDKYLEKYLSDCKQKHYGGC